MKNYIKSMYTIIPSDNFILYLKESEFRRNINHLDFNKKILELFGVLNYMRDVGIDSLYSIESLNDITEK